MPTRYTTRLALRLTRLALEVDQITQQLAAEPHIEIETLIPGAASLLTTALDRLENALYLAEELDQSHRAQDLAVARATADP